MASMSFHQINCLGHQSWSRNTGELLKHYPDFDERQANILRTKGSIAKLVSAKSEVNKLVFALIDELADAFEANAFHAGMDEVFNFGSEFCPRCKGQDPGNCLRKPSLTCTRTLWTNATGYADLGRSIARCQSAGLFTLGSGHEPHAAGDRSHS